ncbi:MAG: ASKHA domain-containing protein, partial [Desulfovibrionaceae bacterium]|nr:ASKHA domain-containing protein [Desulfovibrionaceae bacterium]
MKLRLVSSAVGHCVTEAPAGESLSRAIWLAGQVRAQPLCGGQGRCGRCRVRWLEHAPNPLPEEESVLSPQALAAGWRLACRRTVPDGPGELALELLPENFAPPVPEQPDKGRRDATDGLCLAVDLGTTSLYWQAVCPARGSADDATVTVVGQGHLLNPQAGAGPDVVSRLALARDVRERARLAGLVRAELARLVREWKAEAICLAANPAMTAIFLGADVEGLCAAPYRLDIAGHEFAGREQTAHAAHETVCLPELPPVYIPPLPAPFVGGDVSAGLAALLAADTPRPFVLADLGTNGELALVTETDELFLTSVPLGPALEGIGPECGQLAGPDVLTSFSLTPQGLAGHSPDAASGPARGISATGYLSLLALLRQAGLMDESGLFVEDAAQGFGRPCMPLARKVAQNFCHERGGTYLRLPRGQWLTAADVEELLKVKAAFALALEALLGAAGLAPGGLACLCLAGALGEHICPNVLEQLGFVPSGLSRRIR